MPSKSACGPTREREEVGDAVDGRAGAVPSGVGGSGGAGSGSLPPGFGKGTRGDMTERDDCRVGIRRRGYVDFDAQW